MDSAIQALLSENRTPLQPVPTALQPVLHHTSVGGIFFDIYGTLLISQSGDIGVASESGTEQIFAAALTESGVVPSSGSVDALGTLTRGYYFSCIEEDHAKSRKRGIDFPEVDILLIWNKIFSRLTDTGVLKRTPPASVIREVAARYESLSNHVFPMPGCSEVLSFFKSSHIPMGLISNAQFYTPLLFPALLGKSLTDLGFTEELCIYSYEYGEAKPSEVLFSAALEHLSRCYPDLSPEELLYVGNDMLNDVHAAGNAGFKTVLFAGDDRSLRLRKGDHRCADCSPDFVITDLLQLKEICYIP